VKRRDLVWAGGALLAAGCATRAGEPSAARGLEVELGEPLLFTFGTLDGGELSSDTTRGRTTALLFVTTYDLPSQAEALLLRDLLRAHKPRANGAIVMMEPPRAAPLAQVWADSLGLGSTMPIAMASPSLLSGDSALGRIEGVPTLLVLDRRGRLIARRPGAQSQDEMGALLRQADAA
jgi:hypothetical protein